MQLTCQHCQAAWQYFDRRPGFCPFCGKSLPPEAATEALPAALPASEAETQACAPAAGDAADPEVVGGYRLVRVIGVGGMGKVYEAEDTATDRRVALKLVSADYAKSADALERFRQEGRLASLIAHPRCVFVLAADEEAGRPYIVMELMPGDTLDDFVRKHGPQPPDKAVALILDVIEGLQEAHRVGVVHRDVKPSNCFFDEDGRLKVGDFGLSKSLAQGAHLTKTGSFLGTPLYASPEQVRGEHIDAQTDVYSTAATLYYVLTGKAPFQSDNAAVTLARIAADPAPTLRTLRPELPPALDAVALRGLERDRKRRWQSLEEFAEALRPFLPGRLSLANLGARFGAMAIDYVLVTVIHLLLLPVEVWLGWTSLSDPSVAYAITPQLVLAAEWIVYFGVFESLWSCSPGKWAFGLRVRNAATGGKAAAWRVVLRVVILYLAVDSGALLTVLVLYPLFGKGKEGAAGPAMSPLQLSAFVWGGLLVGAALLLSTMRRSNGFRGLHEIVTGTCVAPMPAGRGRWKPPPAPASQALSRSAGVPERIGSFDVRGAFRWDERPKVLLGQDAALGRQVVIWLRRAGEGPLSAQRRGLNRTTRLRWLAAGHTDGAPWDAFLAPTGGPLPAVIDAGGPMPWPAFQPLLHQLTEELAQALQEGTLPQGLRSDQVWVGSDGRLVLLDVPLTQPGPEADGKGDPDDPESRAMALLDQVAVLGLEGRRVPAAELPGTVRAPLPLPVAGALRDLLGRGPGGGRLSAFRQALLAAQDRPAEVTRGRRAAQLALLVVFEFLALGFCLFPLYATMRFGFRNGGADNSVILAEEAILQLDEASAQDYLCDALHPDPLPRLRSVAQLEADAGMKGELRQVMDRRRDTVQAQMESGGMFYHMVHARMRQDFRQNRDRRLAARLQGWTAVGPARHRRGAAAILGALSDNEDGHWIHLILAWADVFTTCAGPLLWVLWAFVARGGLSYRLTGIALVGGDGRPASRLRCAWRALLVWAPFAAVLLLSYQLDGWYWALWDGTSAPIGLAWLSTVLWWGAWGLLAAYAFLALRHPPRGPHDYLAGTYLVPR
jgi:hypothetical protein